MRIAIIRPCSMQMVPTAHEAALRQMDWCWDRIDTQHWVETPPSGTIAEQRQWMTTEAYQAGCDLFFMLDADMVPYPGLLRELLRVLDLGYDLAGGLCFRRLPPFDPVIWSLDGRQLQPFEDFEFGRIVAAGKTGCAALLFTRRVLDALTPPWFQFIEEVDGERVIHRGEDTYFTDRATRAGFRLGVLAHREHDVGHLQMFEVDRHMWLLFRLAHVLRGWDRVARLVQALSQMDDIEQFLYAGLEGAQTQEFLAQSLGGHFWRLRPGEMPEK